MIDATELAMLLDGIDVQRVKRPPLWEPPLCRVEALAPPCASIVHFVAKIVVDHALSPFHRRRDGAHEKRGRRARRPAPTITCRCPRRPSAPSPRRTRTMALRTHVSSGASRDQVMRGPWDEPPRQARVDTPLGHPAKVDCGAAQSSVQIAISLL